MLSGFLDEVLPDSYFLGLIVRVKVYYIELLDWLYISHLVPNSRIEIFDLSCPYFLFSFFSFSNEDKGLGDFIPISTGREAVALSRNQLVASDDASDF